MVHRLLVWRLARARISLASALAQLPLARPASTVAIVSLKHVSKAAKGNRSLEVYDDFNPLDRRRTLCICIFRMGERISP